MKDVHSEYFAVKYLGMMGEYSSLIIFGVLSDGMMSGAIVKAGMRDASPA